MRADLNDISDSTQQTLRRLGVDVKLSHLQGDFKEIDMKTGKVRRLNAPRCINYTWRNADGLPSLKAVELDIASPLEDQVIKAVGRIEDELAAAPSC